MLSQEPALLSTSQVPGWRDGESPLRPGPMHLLPLNVAQSEGREIAICSTHSVRVIVLGRGTQTCV